MFDLGWSEILLIVAVALIVIGPKDLPQAVRTVTQIIRKMRGMAREFQSGLEDLAREAGVDDIKRDLNEFKADYDPRAALESIADSDREFPDELDDLAGPTEANRIEAPREEPPDLTPAEFGAAEEAPSPPASAAADVDKAEQTSAATPDGADTGDTKRDGGAA